MFPSWWAVMVFGVYKKSEYDCSSPFLKFFSLLNALVQSTSPELERWSFFLANFYYRKTSYRYNYHIRVDHTITFDEHPFYQGEDSFFLSPNSILNSLAT
jgi:hypothetical protein